MQGQTTYGSARDTGSWHDQDCQRQFAFVCKTQVSNNYDPPDSPPSCDGDFSTYTSFGGSCYKFVGEPKSWPDAEADCQHDGAHLVSVQDMMEQSYLHSRMSSNESWLGLSNLEVCD